MISVFAQIVQRLPGHLIEKLARGQKVKAREFSYSAQLYTLMLGQFLHAFSLNERVVLTDRNTRLKYAKEFRRVKAVVEIDGEPREMVFVTNNFTWSARTIADIYKSRWAIEILFKELKQTLQLQSFYGTNANAVKWQIWAALIVHLIMRYLKFESRWSGSYSRFVGIVRTAIWMKKDLGRLLRFYGTAPPLESAEFSRNVPYLPGFEKAYLKAMGQQTA